MSPVDVERLREIAEVEFVDIVVEEAERPIDAFFDVQTGINGLYEPSVIDALIERAELLVTGHRASGERRDMSKPSRLCVGMFARD